MIRDLYAAALAHRIVVEVDIGAFIEAVMWGILAGWGDVVVDIREPVECEIHSGNS
jgi:hypothetical protein